MAALRPSAHARMGSFENVGATLKDIIQAQDMLQKSGALVNRTLAKVRGHRLSVSLW